MEKQPFEDNLVYDLAQLPCSSSSKTFPIKQKLFAGEIHYCRIPVQYWQHRIQMCKAMGLNALSIYIMWNHHEIQKGKFDYQTENKNLTLFLQLAKRYDFKVLIRPGPYVCAQWDWGGLPVRLMSDFNLKIRSNDPKFIEETTIYFNSLKPILKPFLCTKGGHIIMLQIQNEYGMYGCDISYIQTIRSLWKDFDFADNLYYVDPIHRIFPSYWPGANIGINGGTHDQGYEACKKIAGNMLVFGGQIYSGWLTHWGQSWKGKSYRGFVKDYEYLFGRGHSFSMYMAHGGTNFGLTAGANYEYNSSKIDYKADVTSYDYDAPITQQGHTTQKFFAFREMAKKYLNGKFPSEIPDPIARMEVPKFNPWPQCDLFSLLSPPDIINCPQLLSFEHSKIAMFNQGFLLYETELPAGLNQITIEIHDYALVYLNRSFLMTLDRSKLTTNQITFQVKQKNSKLWILVEAMGHTNYSPLMDKDYKGLIIFKDKKNTKFLWNIYKIPIDEGFLKLDKIVENPIDYESSPIFFKYILDIKEPADTFFVMKKWQKGYLFVNGRNLGRYWNKGPQQALYCPGVWLKPGKNEIIIFDLLQNAAVPIWGRYSLHENEKNQIGQQEYHESRECQLY